MGDELGLQLFGRDVTEFHLPIMTRGCDIIVGNTLTGFPRETHAAAITVRSREGTVAHVARMVVLVNGLPAAGKSTLAPGLAKALGLPLLSKDIIKEVHADVLGADPPTGLTQREWNRNLGAAASRTMWAVLGMSSPGAVLESSWRSDVRGLVEAGLRHAGVDHVAEVWCEAPVPLLRERFSRRWASSHPIHGAAPDDDEWAQMVAHAEPLGLGPVLRVDTTVAVDLGLVVEWCRSNAGARNA